MTRFGKRILKTMLTRNYDYECSNPDYHKEFLRLIRQGYVVNNRESRRKNWSRGYNNYKLTQKGIEVAINALRNDEVPKLERPYTIPKYRRMKPLFKDDEYGNWVVNR